MEPGTSPLEIIFDEIEKALEARLHYLAIAVTLMLPDICVTLEIKPGEGHRTGDKYKEWCEHNLKNLSQSFGAEDLYRLRCGVLHQGNFTGHKKSKFAKVLFATPPPSGPIVHDVLMEKGGEVVINFDATTFCREIIEDVRTWYGEHWEDDHVRANIGNLVHFSADGAEGFIVGMPIMT